MAKSGKNRNQARGKAFEARCVSRANELAPSLIVQQVIRDRYTSYSDIEFIDFPDLKVDCKSTISEFSTSMKKRLYKETRMRYAGTTIVILGERKGKSRITWENVTVLYKDTRKKLVVQVHYDEFLLYLVRKKEQFNATSQKKPRKSCVR